MTFSLENTSTIRRLSIAIEQLKAHPEVNLGETKYGLLLSLKYFLRVFGGPCP